MNIMYERLVPTVQDREIKVKGFLVDGSHSNLTKPTFYRRVKEYYGE